MSKAGDRAALAGGVDRSRVLVVDDESTIAHVLRGVLEEYGCDVLTAGSAEEALPLLHGNDFAVALVDIVLPRMNGLQLLGEIKATSRETEVLIMTSQASIETATQAIRNGAYDYLQKPFDDLDTVWMTVKRALEKHSLSRGNRELLVEQDRRNNELTSAVKRLSAMIEAGRAMGDLHPLPELLDRFIGLVVEQLDVDRASLMLIDETGTGLTIAASRGLDDIDPASIRVPLGDGVAGAVAQKGEPFLVRDAGTDPRFGSHPRSDLSGSFLSAPILVSVPIKSSGRVLGVINATNRRNGEPFNEDDLSFLTGMAGQLATAIQRTRHFEELQEAYRSLKDTQEQLIRSERIKALGQMAAGVAHDFNNALSVILSRSESLLARVERGEGDPDSLISGLSAIRKVSLQGAEAIRRIQDYTRMRKDAPDTTVDLNDVVRDAIEITRPKWKDECEIGGASVEIRLDLTCIPPVKGNVHELTQVVGNLIFNAVEAMPAGGSLGFRSRETDGQVELEIADTGLGMSEETRKRLFEPFYTTKPTGQGLGTSIIYGIVARHRGEISVASSEGKGTTFHLRFPAVESRPTETPKEKQVDAADLSGYRVLLVEDDEMVRETFSEILAAHGMDVTCAGSGQEALALVGGSRFDVVVTDLSMPGMSGFDLARGVKQHDPATPVVLLSGWSVQLEEDRVREAGIDQVLVKPCPTSQLVGALRTVLASRGAAAIR